MNVQVAKTSLPPSGAGLAEAAARLPGGPRVHEVRRRAYQAFEALGLPNRRVEDFKYTDLRAMMRSVAPLAPAPEHAATQAAGQVLAASQLGAVHRLVLVDGAYVAELSDGAAEAGVSVRALSDILRDESVTSAADLLLSRIVDPTIALNAAMTTDGVVIDVAEGAVLTKPIHIVHVTTVSGAAAFTRSLVKVNPKAEATIVESYLATPGAAGYQVYDTVVLWAGDEAKVHHVRMLNDAADAANIATALVTLGARCQFNTFSITTGCAVSRYQSFIHLAGEDATLTTNSVHLLRRQQHGDCTFVIEHAVPGCTSRETFRAVLDDRARSVFQGKIVVAPHAQKTDGKMMSRALLLSEDAEIDNKPELEIFADDVQCGHGATVGALDDSLLFYLRARGLDEKQAQALLIQAFVGEAIEAIADETLRAHVVATAENWLEARA